MSDDDATVQWVWEISHDDPGPAALTGTVVPQPPPVTAEITTAARIVNENVLEWDDDPGRCHLFYSYRKAGERAPGRTNPSGNLPFFQPFQTDVKRAAGLLRLGREERIARLNGGGAS